MEMECHDESGSWDCESGATGCGPCVAEGCRGVVVDYCGAAADYRDVAKGCHGVEGCHGIVVDCHGVVVDCHGVVVDCHGVVVDCHGVVVDCHGGAVDCGCGYGCGTGTAHRQSHWQR